MADDTQPADDRQRILDRANRLLKQSRILRKMADELVQESRDIRTSAKRVGTTTKNASPGRRKHR
jgi:hypothetical protein